MKDDIEVHGWILAQEKELLKTPLATIRSGPARCQRTGRKKEFIRFDFSDWVNVVAVTPIGQLVMIRQFRYGSCRPEIEIPGGIIDPGEDPITAGCRELQEETGYRGNQPEIIGKVCPNPALQDNYCYTILVKDAVKSDNPKQDDMEDIECFLRSYKEVTALVRQGTIDHGLVLNALMFYAMTK
ncbi:NUDIX hydrolase [Desulfogranum japonicum]|uniref:NUDIX hydrolase n=1 Tax=Desulfogranum japonicum TaxID=231447 RepID=UPI00041D3000|nr:NUDIX hydrolase [Desulfogranum japonicum]